MSSVKVYDNYQLTFFTHYILNVTEVEKYTRGPRYQRCRKRKDTKSALYIILQLSLEFVSNIVDELPPGILLPPPGDHHLALVVAPRKSSESVTLPFESLAALREEDLRRFSLAALTAPTVCQE